MGPSQILPLWVRVDRGVMPMKRYSTLTRSQELEPQHQIKFRVILRTPHFFRWGVLIFYGRYSQINETDFLCLESNKTFYFSGWRLIENQLINIIFFSNHAPSNLTNLHFYFWWRHWSTKIVFLFNSFLAIKIVWSAGLQIHWLYPYGRVRQILKGGILGMALKYIWRSGESGIPFYCPNLLVGFNPERYFPVGWGCRIHRRLLCSRGDPQTSVLCMALNNLMVRLPGPLSPGVVAPDRAL